MPDRASFWSGVPEWSQARLAGPRVSVGVTPHGALWLVSGNTQAFLAQHGLHAAIGPRAATDAACYALRLAPDRLLFVSEAPCAGEFGFTGDGCAISQAAASLLTEEVKGLTLAEVKEFPKERLLELVGVPLSMARVKCALLSLKVLKAGAYGLPDADVLHP